MDSRGLYDLSQKLVTVGFILTLLEWIGSRFLFPVIGTLGIPILRARLPSIPEDRLPLGEGIQRVDGIRVRRARGGGTLFFSSMSKTSFFSIHTPCPLKCSLTRLRESRETLLVGRFPVGFLLFVVGWATPFVTARDFGLALVGGLLFVSCIVTEYVRAKATGEALVRAMNESVQTAP